MWYQHLTTKALIEPYHLTCVLFDISVLIVRFVDRARACRVYTSTSHRKRTRRPSIKVSWPFDESCDKNASDDDLSLSASVAVNKTNLGSDARYNTYARDGSFRHIN